MVIKTLCSYIPQMEPQEIPPLLQQILLFCTNGEFLNLFCILQKYFDHKILVYYNNEETNLLEMGINYVYNNY